MNKVIRKAVFPVAGFGTRFLPATKANPKEMLPIVDKPLIQYAFEEAMHAGITEMIFVTGRNKRAIEDHFDTAYELEAGLAAAEKTALLEKVRLIKPAHITCIYIRQPFAFGLGHAVLCARAVVRDEPFAVILADDLIDAQPGVLTQMVKLFEQYQHSLVAVEPISLAQTESYGVIKGTPHSEHLLFLDQIIEKPKPEHAPSQWGVVGRYIFTPDLLECLYTLTPGKLGEIQLTDAIQKMIATKAVYAYAFEGQRYDCGSKLGYLKATVDYALKHNEIKNDFTQYLREIIS